MKKQTVKINEAQLSKIVAESVKKVLNEENAWGGNGDVWKLIDILKLYMSPDDILARLISRIGEYQALKYLEDIKNTEISGIG